LRLPLERQLADVIFVEGFFSSVPKRSLLVVTPCQPLVAWCRRVLAAEVLRGRVETTSAYEKGQNRRAQPSEHSSPIAHGSLSAIQNSGPGGQSGQSDFQSTGVIWTLMPSGSVTYTELARAPTCLGRPRTVRPASRNFSESSSSTPIQ